MIKITFSDGSTVLAESLDALSAEDSRRMMLAYAAGAPPTIAPVVPESIAPVPPVAPASEPKFSSWSEQVIDSDAKARIDAQHAAIVAMDPNAKAVLGKGGTGTQAYENGTRMMHVGYETVRGYKAEHERMRPLRDVAAEAVATIEGEKRRQINVSAAEAAANVRVENGKITLFGFRVSEQAIRGWFDRIEGPGLGYVLGLRDRIASNVGRDKPAIARDIAWIVETMQREASVSPDRMMMLRAREGVGDVFAIVSPDYGVCDVPDALPGLVSGILDDAPNARGSWTYETSSTNWEVRADVFSDTPVDTMAVGEPFKAFAAFRGRDNGTGSWNSGGGFELIRCLNATIYTCELASARVRHRGTKVRDQVWASVDQARKAISLMISGWGRAREQVIAPSKDVIEGRKSMDQFLGAMFLDMLKSPEFAGTFPGNSRANADALVATFHAERRDENRIVRADLANAVTRALQKLPTDRAMRAQSAAGAWIVGGAGILA